MRPYINLVSIVIVLTAVLGSSGLFRAEAGPSAPAGLAPLSGCVCELEITTFTANPFPASCLTNVILYAEGYEDGNCGVQGCGAASDCEYDVSISMIGNNCGVMAIWEFCENPPHPIYVDDCQDCSVLSWAPSADPSTLGCGETRCYNAYACNQKPCGFAGNLAASITIECMSCQ